MSTKHHNESFMKSKKGTAVFEALFDRLVENGFVESDDDAELAGKYAVSLVTRLLEPMTYADVNTVDVERFKLVTQAIACAEFRSFKLHAAGRAEEAEAVRQADKQFIVQQIEKVLAQH